MSCARAVREAAINNKVDSGSRRPVRCRSQQTYGGITSARLSACGWMYALLLQSRGRPAMMGQGVRPLLEDMGVGGLRPGKTYGYTGGRQGYCYSGQRRGIC